MFIFTFRIIKAYAILEHIPQLREFGTTVFSALLPEIEKIVLSLFLPESKP
jgi:hypothetical protein